MLIMSFKFNRLPQRQNEKMVYGPATRKLPKWQWYLLAVVILSPVLYFFGKIFLNLFLITASGFISTDTMTIRAPYDAYVANIHVHLANKVEIGDLLIALHSPSLNAQIAALQANITSLQTLQESYTDETLPALLKAEVTATRHVKETQSYYADIERNYKKGLTTVMNLSAAESNYSAAQNNLEQIQAQITKQQDTFSITSQQNYDQILAPVQQTLASLQAINKGLLIKAEQAGVVTSLTTQGNEFVDKGMPLMTLNTNHNWHVTAFFEGKSVAALHPGQRVILLLPDFTILSGHIMNQPSMTQSETQMFVVLQNPNQRLVAYISFDEPLPKKYQVNGMQITVVLK